MSKKAEITVEKMIEKIGMEKSKYYRWEKMNGVEETGIKSVPRSHWIMPEEKESIIKFAKENYSNNDYFIKTGYRRIAYMLMDKDIAFVSPSSVYRILKETNLLNNWSTKKTNLKGTGFVQPEGIHRHWHTDIKYLRIEGRMMYLISVIDGYSRYILHHEVRQTMEEKDVEITIQRAKDKYPEAKPRIITDNGSQFISKEFKYFISQIEATHVRTSVNYPQSNGKIERFHKTISSECLRVKTAYSLERQKEIIREYIEYYNNERLHSSIFYLTPSDILFKRDTEKLEIREKKLILAEAKRKTYWMVNGSTK